MTKQNWIRIQTYSKDVLNIFHLKSINKWYIFVQIFVLWKILNNINFQNILFECNDSVWSMMEYILELIEMFLGLMDNKTSLVNVCYEHSLRSFHYKLLWSYGQQNLNKYHEYDKSLFFIVIVVLQTQNFVSSGLRCFFGGLYSKPR